MNLTSPAPAGDANCCPQCGGQVTIKVSGPAEESPCPHCGKMVWFVRREVDGIVILTFLPGLIAGRESIDRVDEVTAAMGDSSRIVLDVSVLRFLSSLFLGMLIRLHLRVASAKKTMKICGLRPEAFEVFKVTKLDGVFDLHAELETALKGF